MSNDLRSWFVTSQTNFTISTSLRVILLQQDIRQKSCERTGLPTVCRQFKKSCASMLTSVNRTGYIYALYD
ncbi:hypothetical protein E3N88_20572 [Mikania micrantha]|uniref:Uncharacterized protein n=1 Tax=Mikania micrantha TaxID=192012 RepID=A0A5N6NIK0_9ASTR|nr:hypothetical protein E3N88_20572 [Mikania micrantha]